MEATKAAPRYGINSYLEWVATRRDPGRRGARARSLRGRDRRLAALRRERRRPAHFTGSGDYCNMFVLEIPRRRLDAAAAASLRRDLLRARRPRLDAARVRRRHASAASSGARAASSRSRSTPSTGTSTPAGRSARCSSRRRRCRMMMNIFHNEDVHLQHAVRVRGPDRRRQVLHAARATCTCVRPGNNIWETNFVPDLGDDRADAVGRPRRRLDQHQVRAGRRDHARAHLGDRAGDLQEGAPAQRRDARPDAHRRRLLAAVVRRRARDFKRVDWKYGVVFPPCEGQFHQHFVTSNHASRYVATGLGNMRYPLTDGERRAVDRHRRAQNRRRRAASKRAATRSSTRIRIRASTRSGSKRCASAGSRPSSRCSGRRLSGERADRLPRRVERDHRLFGTQLS